jgi:hypothetical protein
LGLTAKVNSLCISTLAKTKEPKGNSMKTNLSVILICVLAWFFGASVLFGDTLVFSTGRTLSGIILQTNGDDLLVLTKYAAFNFSKTNIKEIKADTMEASESSSPGRLPNFKQAILFLSKQPWVVNLTPIPATVIDKGILRNVPYTSFRCNGDYEVNIYGDLENPSGIEIGVYRKLLNDSSAKENCVQFINGLLSQSADKEILLGLDLKKDLKTHDGLTFEITPPGDEDAYNGWWVSVYSEKQLNLARASDGEMNQISMTQADAAKNAKESKSLSSWSADELKQARTASNNTTITFTNSSGMVVSNAAVVRVIDGVSLIWRNGPSSGGMVRLADLPETLRIRFGYDPVKTQAADNLAKDNRDRWQQEVQAAVQAQADQTVPMQPDSFYLGNSVASSDSSYSGGGSVYVHGYTRSNGTYVNAYTRSAPHRH